MEKIFFLVLLFAVAAVHAQDGVLINTTNADVEPIWRRTGPSTQLPPAAYGYSIAQDNVHWMSENNDVAPALYWGNTFTISNVFPQNDTQTLTRKRLTAQWHFEMENQTIAMVGQEYLIRPRGIAYYNPSTKRVGEQLPGNGQFSVSGYGWGVHALNVTPQWAAFRLTNSSGPSNHIAFFESEAVHGQGASFTLWASNPSMLYIGPGSRNFNVSDPSMARANQMNFFKEVDIEWVVACRWIANGTDCGDDLVIAPDVCELQEFGLCWSRFESPANFRIETPTESSDYDSPMSPFRTGNWAILVSPRPLALTAAFQSPAFMGPQDTFPPSVEMEVLVGKDSKAVIVSLPLNDEILTPFETESFSSSGTAQNEWLSRFMPGKDNAGGSLEITVRAIIEVPDTTNFPNQVSRYVTHIQMVPPKVVISRDQPTASFYFTNITKPLGVQEYVVHFLVTETNPSTISVSNSTASIGEFEGAYPNGAYSIPTLVLQPQPYDFEIRNFFPENAQPFEMPITPEVQFNCSAAGHSYIAQLAASPASIGQTSITVPFNITPAGSIKFWTCPSGSKRQSAPTQITSFTFVGTTTSVVFYLTTQTTPIEGVSLTFGTPILSTPGVIDPSSFVFAGNGTYLFTVVQNDVHVEVTNHQGFPSAGADETGGPFFNQDFYMQFKWTPVTPNGFNIAITGLNTAFPSTAVVTNNGTTGTFTVPGGVTGFLAGPFRATPPRYDFNSDTTDVVYAVSLVAKATGVSDNLWYTLPSAVTVVRIAFHRFAVTNWLGGEYELMSTGQQSQPFCIAPAFRGAFASTDQIWVTVVSSPADAGIIFEPVVPVAGARPPNALLLTAAQPEACFTARFDTNWQFDGPTRSMNSASIALVASGPGMASNGLYYPSNGPSLTIYMPEISFAFVQSSQTDCENCYLAGETALIMVDIEALPPHSLAYNVTCSAGRITPVSANAGLFTPTGEMQHLWQIYFDVLPVSEEDSSHLGSDPIDYYEADVRIIGYGEDEAFYSKDQMISGIRVIARRVQFASQDLDGPLDIGATIPFAVTAQLSNPVVNGLTVTPWARSSGAISGGLSFIPASFTFTPTTVTRVQFAVTGEMLGDYEFGFSFSGPDQNIFRMEPLNDSPDPTFTASVERRPAPEVVCDSPFIAGIPQRCHVDFHAPVPAGEEVVVTLDYGSDFILSEDTFDGADSLQYFDATWIPEDPAPLGEISRAGSPTFHTLTGADAWKYEPLEQIALEDADDLNYQSFSISFSEQKDHTTGVRYNAFLSLDYGSSPEGFRIFLLSTNVLFYEPGATTPSSSPTLPYIISFDAGGEYVHYFDYEITAPAVEGTDSTMIAEVDLVLDYSLPGTRFYASSTSSIGLEVVQRQVFFDFANIGDDGILRNPLVTVQPQSGFMVNHQSPLLTLVLSAPSASDLTVTISHPSFSFNDGQQSAVVVFVPGQLSSTFTFTPLTLVSTDLFADQLNVAVSGAEAAMYSANSVFETLANIFIVPELGFSPIPAVPVDGTVSGLKVWLVDALAQGFTHDANTQFKLHVRDPSDAFVFSPSTLEFSPAALEHNRLSQEYSIHAQPRHSYIDDFHIVEIEWQITFGSANPDTHIDITGYVPRDAQNFLVTHYQIYPDMPRKMNFKWQRASFNMSRAPLSHMTLIPHAARLDGQGSGFSPQHYSGHSAGGRIVFDPPTIVVNPGQQVVHFNMMAIPGNAQGQVYYRVTWEMQGDEDDLYCYTDYIMPRSDDEAESDVRGHFATWHIASSVSLQLSFALFATLLTFFLLL